jgi:hypothetical protein
MAKTQAERIAALEAQLTTLSAALDAFPAVLQEALRKQLDDTLRPMAEELVRAHARIDHAGEVFKKLRTATTQALTPRHEPRLTVADRKAWHVALSQLRTERGLTETAFVPKDDVLARIRENEAAVAE